MHAEPHYSAISIDPTPSPSGLLEMSQHERTRHSSVLGLSTSKLPADEVSASGHESKPGMVGVEDEVAHKAESKPNLMTSFRNQHARISKHLWETIWPDQEVPVENDEMLHTPMTSCHTKSLSSMSDMDWCASMLPFSKLNELFFLDSLIRE